MNEGGNEVLLQECQTSKRPIDNYIDYFEEYQNHTLQAKKHLTYYLSMAFAATLFFHAFKIALQVGYTSNQWIYYLPFFLWFQIVARFNRSFTVNDPHILNDRKDIAICSCSIDLFNFYMVAFVTILVSLMVVHIFWGLKGKYLLLVDLLTFLLNLRVVLQVKHLQQRLKNTVACFRNNKNYYLKEFTYGQMKEPFEEQQPEKEERYSMLHEKVNEFLNPATIRTQKTMKISRYNSTNSFDEQQVYSN